MSKQGGLTLIELMVGILIVALISTVALISVKNARAKARDTKRVYDIQQYAKAFRLYAQEHDGALPVANGYLGRGEAIDTQLNPYLPGTPGDIQDRGGIGSNDYYYYYVANNVCSGQPQATIHVQTIETSNQDFHNNPCVDGLGGSENGYANLADYLIIADQL